MKGDPVKMVSLSIYNLFLQYKTVMVIKIKMTVLIPKNGTVSFSSISKNTCGCQRDYGSRHD